MLIKIARADEHLTPDSIITLVTWWLTVDHFQFDVTFMEANLLTIPSRSEFKGYCIPYISRSDIGDVNKY